MRITKIEGELNGVKFTVKPTPINVSQVETDVRDMLREWYKEHYPGTFGKIDGNTDFEDYTAEDIKALNAWRTDVEFRAKYLRKMAESCMKFEKPVPEGVWASDDLEYSTIREAWDFFSEKRLV